MLVSALRPKDHTRDTGDESLFEAIATDLLEKGYSICPSAMPANITEALEDHLQQMDPDLFDPAAVGRLNERSRNRFVRTDAICWINGESHAGRQWLDWAASLQRYLNGRLFLGLFSFESHFAHYAAGDFYKRHYDAFRGDANRVLSIAVYLNRHWTVEDGGELALYMDDDDTTGVKVTPLAGTIVAFLSEEFPHEVLPASRDRYSVTGWYRLNTSHAGRVDPPA